MLKKLAFGLLLATALVAAMALVMPVDSAAGEWDHVCCNNPAECGEDHCTGTGTLNCCKAIPF